MQPNIVKAFTVTFIVYFIFNATGGIVYFLVFLHVLRLICSMMVFQWSYGAFVSASIVVAFYFKEKICHFAVRFNRCNCWFSVSYHSLHLALVRKQLHSFYFSFLFSNLEKYVLICWIDWNWFIFLVCLMPQPPKHWALHASLKYLVYSFCNRFLIVQT